MRALRKFRLRLRSAFERSKVDRELDDELAFHVDELTRENVSRGMSAGEARYAAMRAMGGVAQSKESCRDTRCLNLMEDALKDMRHGARMLRRTPGFAAIAIACLALGIGASTAIFTVINAVLLRPLPFPDSGRLVGVWEETPIFNLRYSPPALGNYVDWKAQGRSFESMGAYERQSFRLTGQGEPEELEGATASASLFRTLGVSPVRGRLFRDEEDRAGSTKLAVISYSLWQRRFARSESAVGSPLVSSGTTYTIAGVLPQDFRFPDALTEVWSNFGAEYDANEFYNRDRHNLTVVARLQRGVTIGQANGEIRSIASRLSRNYPKTNYNVGAFVAPLRAHMAGDVKLYAILLAAVSCLLLIACANVANLLVSRAITRTREIAVRVALGAGRARVLRQLAVEHVLLAVLGGAGGTLLALASQSFLRHLVPENLGAMVPLGFDWRVFVFSLLATAATCVLFSFAPAAQAFRIDVNEGLKQQGERTGASRGMQAVRKGLVVTEIALAMMLLIGAGLLARTFAALTAVNLGCRTDHLLTLRTPVPFTPNLEQKNERYRLLLARLKTIPGVLSTGYTIGVPLAFKGWFEGVMVEPGQELQSVYYRVVTPDYFRAMGIRLLTGRELNESDGLKSTRVALVNEAFARRFWPGQNPVGRRFRQEMGSSGVVVAGVVGDVHQAGLDVPPGPEVYIPYQQSNVPPAALVIRTSGDPVSVLAAVRREIRAVDKDLPIKDVRTMEQVVRAEMFPRRFLMLLMISFAGAALLLASIGIYGVLSYIVTQRRREIGLRMALGAARSGIIGGILRQAFVMVACGAGIGIAVSLALTRLMSHLLFGVTPTDPLTFAGVPAVLTAVALAASYIPARRAVMLDPALVLRDE